MAKPKVDSTPMQCILSPGTQNNIIIDEVLMKHDIVPELHELNDGYTLYVLGQELDYRVQSRLGDVGWYATNVSQFRLDSFLKQVAHGIPSLRIFRSLQGQP